MGKQKKTKNNITKVQINLEWIIKIDSNTDELKSRKFVSNL